MFETEYDLLSKPYEISHLGTQSQMYLKAVLTFIKQAFVVTFNLVILQASMTL